MPRIYVYIGYSCASRMHLNIDHEKCRFCFPSRDNEFEPEMEKNVRRTLIILLFSAFLFPFDWQYKVNQFRGTICIVSLSLIEYGITLITTFQDQIWDFLPDPVHLLHSHSLAIPFTFDSIHGHCPWLLFLHLYHLCQSDDQKEMNLIALHASWDGRYISNQQVEEGNDWYTLNSIIHVILGNGNFSCLLDNHWMVILSPLTSTFLGLHHLWYLFQEVYINSFIHVSRRIQMEVESQNATERIS